MRKVQEQVEDPNQDLNLEQFNELLSQLQQARENGVQILSYQEYPGAIYTESLNAKDFSDAYQRQLYLDSVFGSRNMRNSIDESVSVGTDDNILTLSTCISGEPNNRYIVEAVRVDE